MLYHLRKHADRGAFGPEQIRAMTTALDEAWKTVQTSGISFPSKRHVEATREILALRIIDMAQLGETDFTRLRDDALLHLAKTNSKSMGV